MVDNKSVINQLLTQIQKRRFKCSFILKLTQFLLIGLCVLIPAFIVNRFILLPISLTNLTIIVVAITIISSFIMNYIDRNSLKEIANIIDQRLNLKERISTSLELIQKNSIDEISHLQINDTANSIADAEPTDIESFVLPKFLKLIPIPLIIIGLTFQIPRQYELPIPLTNPEREVIDTSIQNLSDALNQIDNPIIKKEINNTINQLKNADDFDSVHKQLQKLNVEVQNQKSLVPDETDIHQITQTIQHFEGMNSAALADEIERLSQNAVLDPHLKEALNTLYQKLSEKISQIEHENALNSVKGKVVSEDKLNDIVGMLRNIEQLDNLDKLIMESRKKIALANIEKNQSNGGFANSESTYGQESGNKEVQGTQDTNEPINTDIFDSDTTTSKDDSNTEKPLIGDEVPSNIISENDFTLDSDNVSDSGQIARIYTGQSVDETTEPIYMSYSEIMLSAEREFSNAIESNSIPVRFRSQIKAYLQDISEIDE